MIDKSLLTAKGTIDALAAMNTGPMEGPCDVAMLSAAMDVSKGTARRRLNTLTDAGLVTQEAEMIDDSPQRVFTLTDDGSDVAALVEELLNDSPSVAVPDDE